MQLIRYGTHLISIPVRISYFFFGGGGEGPKVYIVTYEQWIIVYYSYNFLYNFCFKYDNLKRIIDFHPRSIISAKFLPIVIEFMLFVGFFFGGGGVAP